MALSPSANSDSYSSFVKILTVLLITVSIAALVIIANHCMNVHRFNRRSQHRRPSVPEREEVAPSNVENSIAELIPTHKYHKSSGLVRDDGTCAVCLCEFEEDEELRTLPECVHSFHVPCIDMWLHSHTTCCFCRTDAMPSLPLFVDSSLEGLITPPDNNINSPNLDVHLRVL